MLGWRGGEDYLVRPRVQSVGFHQLCTGHLTTQTKQPAPTADRSAMAWTRWSMLCQ
jgi:hypothetical protein